MQSCSVWGSGSGVKEAVAHCKEETLINKLDRLSKEIRSAKYVEYYMDILHLSHSLFTMLNNSWWIGHLFLLLCYMDPLCPSSSYLVLFLL